MQSIQNTQSSQGILPEQVNLFSNQGGVAAIQDGGSAASALQGQYNQSISVVGGKTNQTNQTDPGVAWFALGVFLITIVAAGFIGYQTLLGLFRRK